MAWTNSDSLGVISALAAIASAIYAGKTYRAAVALKKHESGLQLRLANETLRATVLPLPALLQDARRSRLAVSAARGLARSGAMQAWEQRFTEIEGEIRAIQKRLPDEVRPESLSFEDLTDQLATTHELQLRASAVQGELADGLRQDDRDRDHIQEDHRVITAARLAQSDRK